MIAKAEIHTTVQNIPWLMELSPFQFKQLVRISGLKYLETGEILFREGDTDNLLYIVSEGRLSIDIMVPKHGNLRIYTAEALDILGWDSMTPVARQRTTTITALSPCCLIYIESNALSELCEADSTLGYIVMRRISNIIASRMLSMRIQLLDLILTK
jgi:CRP-like cAMP-binding protein